MSAHLPHSEAARAVAFAISALVAEMQCELGRNRDDLVRAARDVLAEKLDAFLHPSPFVEPTPDLEIGRPENVRFRAGRAGGTPVVEIIDRRIAELETKNKQLFEEVKRLERERDRRSQEIDELHLKLGAFREIHEAARR